MLKIKNLSDKAAISLSILCSAHCLLFPIIMIAIPSVVSLSLNGEAFHFWILIAVFPISVYALTMGCKHHRRYHILALGGLGLLLLLLALYLAGTHLNELGEKSLTLLGAILVSIGHYRNYKLSLHNEHCSCHEQSSALSLERESDV